MHGQLESEWWWPFPVRVLLGCLPLKRSDISEMSFMEPDWPRKDQTVANKEFVLRLAKFIICH